LIKEKELQRALLNAIGTIANLNLFERANGFATVGKKRTPIVFGTPGQCDLWGVWYGTVHIEIELKSVNGKLSSEQKAWKAFCLQNGIPHLVLQAWTAESIEQTVERWCKKIETTRPKNGVITLQITNRPYVNPDPGMRQVTLLPSARKDLKIV